MTLAALALGSGCTTPPTPAPEPPPLARSTARWTGALLEGPGPRPPPEARPEHCPLVDIAVRMVSGHDRAVVGRGPPDERPADTTRADGVAAPGRPAMPDLPRADTRAPLVVSVGDRSPLRAVAALTAGTRAGPLEAEGPAGPADDGTAAATSSAGEPLLPGTTLQIRWTPERPPRTAGPSREAAGLLIALAEDGTIDVGVEVVGRLPGESVRHRELLVLEAAPVPDGLPLGIVVPFPVADDDATALAMQVRVSSAPRGGEARERHASAVADARRALAEQSRAPRAAPGPVPGRDARAAGDGGLAVARDGLLARSSRRASLILMAESLGAPFAHDLALTADDGLVAGLAGMAAAVARDDLEHGAFALEGAALDLVVARLMDGEPHPNLLALLARRVGEVAHAPGLVRDLVGSCTDLASFEERLLEENLLSLEDPAPGPRVRAFDWLAARDRAPDGYDPLGARRDRRRALARHDEEAEDDDGDGGGAETAPANEPDGR